MDAETINRIQAELDEIRKVATEEGGSRMVTVADVLEKLGCDLPLATYEMSNDEKYWAIYNTGWVLDDNDNVIKFIGSAD